MRWLFLVPLGACVFPITDVEHAANLDQDRDGHLPIEAGGADCDDTNPAIHPDAVEWCNEVDDDCDGVVDPDGARGSRPYWTDADGDGGGDPLTLVWSCQAGDRLPNDHDCDDTDPLRTPADLDGDGWSGCTGDCDDANPYAWPGAPEWCGDGLDNDCSGAEDDDPFDPLPWYADGDGDGVGGDTLVFTCDPPPSHVAGTGDCDDGNASVFPGAPETCNQLDDDCDTEVDEDATDATWWYSDTDGDGHGDPATGVWGCTGGVVLGDDCDDGDINTFPGTEEVCGDGVDNDCDRVGCGLPAGDLLDTDGAISVSGVSSLGASSEAGDLTGDGRVDLVLGAPDAGTVYLFDDPAASVSWDVSAASAQLSDALGPEGALGWTLAIGDVVGTSAVDLVVAAPWSGAPTDSLGMVTVLPGPVMPGTWTTNDAAATVVGVESDGAFGAALALGDLTGDSRTDLVVAAPDGATGGSVSVYDTPLAGQTDVGGALASLQGPGGLDAFGEALWVGDLTGDGYADLAVGAPGTADGDVWIFAGPIVSGSLTHADAAGHVYGASPSSGLGSMLASGDLDGDAALDLVALAPGSGSVHVIAGPWLPNGVEVSTVRGATRTGTLSPEAVVAVGDLNGDGLDDLAVGDPGADLNGPDTGAVWLFYGPVTGEATLDDADSRILGATDSQGVGGSLRFHDLNDDGVDDLIVGAPAPGAAMAADAHVTVFPGANL